MHVKVRLHEETKAPTWLWGIAFVVAGILFVLSLLWGLQRAPKGGIQSLQASVISAKEEHDDRREDVDELDHPIQLSQAFFEQGQAVLNTNIEQDYVLNKPTSFLEFAQQDFQGTDFQVIRVLFENEWFTKYEIRYTSNGLLISGVFLMPKKVQNPPLAVLNHGWFDVDEYKLGKGLRREQDFLAQSGYAVLHSDYRGHAFSDKDENLIYDGSLGYATDVINAINALKGSGFASQVNTDQIVMLGHSMGGDITLDIITAFPDLVDAAVLYAPASGKAWLNYDRWKEQDFSEAYRTNTKDVLGSYAQNKEGWEALSSDSYKEAIKTPLWVFHGEKDDVVPIAWSDDLVRDLESLEKKVIYTIYPEEDHQFEQNFWDFAWEARRFFDEQVKR